MKSNIKGFPNYYWDGEGVWNISKNKTIKQTESRRGSFKFVKMKNEEDKWDSIKINTVEFLAGRWDVPSDFRIVPYTESKVFINELGEIYSIASTKYGVPLIPYHKPEDPTKYPSVIITYRGVRGKVNIHQLMCVTFYDKDYVQKGLVCLHKDNDKSNYRLSNLKVGTYSENNKQAYDDGINRGRS
ncbi:hypothetical protein MYOV085v1_p0138 [Vibrio phage 355E48.1]|nr:hypothetical protein MYOV085v1_p0138 [Vibrio phage 355E48.1]